MPSMCLCHAPLSLHSCFPRQRVIFWMEGMVIVWSVLIACCSYGRSGSSGSAVLWKNMQSALGGLEINWYRSAGDQEDVSWESTSARWFSLFPPGSAWNMITGFASRDASSSPHENRPTLRALSVWYSDKNKSLQTWCLRSIISMITDTVGGNGFTPDPSKEDGFTPHPSKQDCEEVSWLERLF